MFIVKTTIPANEIRDFELSLYDNGFNNFEFFIDYNTMYITLGFIFAEDAAIFRLRAFDEYYISNKLFYFEPDAEFEIELEQIYGIYSDADDYYIRQ